MGIRRIGRTNEQFCSIAQYFAMEKAQRAVIHQCVVPEKIHTHPMEGHWKFLRGGES